MGTNFKCGCRFSMGSWFLCDEHELEVFAKLEIDEEEEDVSMQK